MFIDNNLKIIIVKNNHNLKRDLSKLEILGVVIFIAFCLYTTPKSLTAINIEMLAAIINEYEDFLITSLQSSAIIIL